MIKLIAALATARGGVDRAIAYGEAVPRLERLKSIILIGLVAACAILAVGYIHLSSNLSEIEAHQRQGNLEREQILHQLEVAQGDRWVIMKAVTGK